MYKVELYKISHSPNLLYLMSVVMAVSIFLSVSDPSILLNTAFVSSSAVLMLYITIFAIFYVNRDYSANNFRVLIGTGLSRNRIITTKYVVFSIVSFVIISIHVAIVMGVPIIFNKVSLSIDQIQNILFYYFVYAAIISVVFFISVISKTLIKSIMLNLGFIIISSIIVASFSPISLVPVIPLQSLQFISSDQGEKHIVVISTLLYIAASYSASCVSFLKQEL
ncbi:ABC transporter permease [Paenibacillus fonticola]|uniref:ABC transporter permease n=1 Tax=Paenibacillus fonticola TaxID=379896 RepID=UPI00036148F0|nr:ABC transporter permease [Paenibacillus fonticola]